VLPNEGRGRYDTTTLASLSAYRWCSPLSPTSTFLHAGIRSQNHNPPIVATLVLENHASRAPQFVAAPTRCLQRPLNLEARSWKLDPAPGNPCSQHPSLLRYRPLAIEAPLYSICYLARASVHKKRTVSPVVILCLSALLSAATSAYQKPIRLQARPSATGIARVLALFRKLHHDRCSVRHSPTADKGLQKNQPRPYNVPASLCFTISRDEPQDQLAAATLRLRVNQQTHGYVPSVFYRYIPFSPHHSSRPSTTTTTYVQASTTVNTTQITTLSKRLDSITLTPLDRGTLRRATEGIVGTRRFDQPHELAIDSMTSCRTTQVTLYK
jgi:hypothetical protein